MTNNPLTSSIVLCTYNGKKYLPELLYSLFAQTYAATNIVIVDDQSTDDTLELVRHICCKKKRTSRIQIYVNNPQKGAAANFIYACSLCKTDVIFLCDQDDIWFADKIETMLTLMQQHPDINVLASSLKPLYETGVSLKNRFSISAQPNNGKIVHVSPCASNISTRRSGCTMCIRKSFFDTIKPYWKEGWFHDDFFWKMAFFDQSLYFVNHRTILRRIHNSNASVYVKRTVASRVCNIEQEKQYTQWAYGHMGNQSLQNIVQKYLHFLDMRISLLKQPRVLEYLKLLLSCKKLYRSKVQGLMDGYFIIKQRLGL